MKTLGVLRLNGLLVDDGVPGEKMEVEAAARRFGEAGGGEDDDAAGGGTEALRGAGRGGGCTCAGRAGDAHGAGVAELHPPPPTAPVEDNDASGAPPVVVGRPPAASIAACLNSACTPSINRESVAWPSAVPPTATTAPCSSERRRESVPNDAAVACARSAISS